MPSPSLPQSAQTPPSPPPAQPQPPWLRTPLLSLMAPEVVFLPGGTNVTLSIAGSDDLDGTVVRRTWTLVAVRPSDIFDRVTASSLGTGSTETVTISNVTERCEFVYTVELEDNDGGVINSGPRSVVFKYLSAAVAVANTDVTERCEFVYTVELEDN